MIIFTDAQITTIATVVYFEFHQSLYTLRNDPTEVAICNSIHIARKNIILYFVIFNLKKNLVKLPKVTQA